MNEASYSETTRPYSPNVRDDLLSDVNATRIYQEDHPKINIQTIKQLREVHTRRLSQLRTDFGDHHPRTIILCINLAEAYSSLGYHHEAAELYSAALEARKMTLGDQHQDTLTSYNRLGGAYSSLKDYCKAMELYSWSLELTKMLYGDESLNTAALYSSMAYVSGCLGDDDEVVELRLICVNIIKKLQQGYINQPDDSICCDNIAAQSFLKEGNIFSIESCLILSSRRQLLS